MMQKKWIRFNSMLLYVSAFLLTTIIHELAHALVGIWYSSTPILHHNYVEHLAIDHLSNNQLILIAIAGPLASLIQGVIAAMVFVRSKTKSLTTLFILWLSILGFNNFFGYLMTGPIFSNGDIGKVLKISHTALWIQIVIALIGAAMITIIAYKVTKPFLQFATEEDMLKDAKSRKNFSFHIIILPWIIGSIIVSVLYMPIIAIISIIYPIMSGMVFIFPWQNASSIDDALPTSNKKIAAFSASVLIGFVVLSLVFKFVLAPGIVL